MHVSYLLPNVFLCRGYLCTYQFYLNWKLISAKSDGGKSAGCRNVKVLWMLECNPLSLGTNYCMDQM